METISAAGSRGDDNGKSMSFDREDTWFRGEPFIFISVTALTKGDADRRSDSLRPGTGVLGANGDDKCEEGGEMDGAGARGVA